MFDFPELSGYQTTHVSLRNVPKIHRFAQAYKLRELEAAHVSTPVDLVNCTETLGHTWQLQTRGKQIHINEKGSI